MLLRQAILDHKHKFIYFVIGKSACTSVRTALAQLIGLPPLKQWHEIYGAAWPNVVDKRVAMRFPDYFRFTVVRSPWGRLVSCYSDKVNDRVNRIRELTPNTGFTHRMPFPAFVENVCRIPDENANIHIVSQTELLYCDGQPVVDHFLRFDCLQEDWAIAQRHLPGLGPLPRVNASGHQPVERYFTEALNAMVRERYADDIKNLHYREPGQACVAMPGTDS